MQQNSIDTWTKTLIQEIVSHGVTYFCLSPGSRSTPLAIAISSHLQAEAFVHFDERAMAFHALGYAKAIKKPVVIVTTSGTACGNLLPAIMEAHESSIPLIILTADRPYELQECGANQTTNQIGMFQNYVRWQHQLPHPEFFISEDCLKTTIAHAIAKATRGHKGPVHLNCMFREPFFSTTYNPLDPFIVKEPKTTLLSSKISLSEDSTSLIVSLMNSSKKGLILLGYETFDQTTEELSSFYALAETLQWPIISDVLSQVKTHPLILSYYDLICKTLASEELSPDCVLHFGGNFVSKHLLTFLKNATPKTYIHISPYEKRQDPAHLITHRVTLSPLTFCEEILPLIEPKTPSSYLSYWSSLNICIESTLKTFFIENKGFSEPHIFNALAHYDLSSHALFIASSMPIRDLMDFSHPQNPPIGIYGNRGLSGIDGNIATAIGIAKALSTPMIVILGDQTFLHDFSSLSQLKYLKHPMIFLIINNDGGNIFSYLPIYEKKTVCEAYFINPHGFKFSHVAAMFGLSYFHHQSLEAFQQDFPKTLSSSHHHLIELQTHREDNLKTHQTIKELIVQHAPLSMLRQ
jgi:2-succinyl-5-enolpyruvyl-6-hydroxy-3-cyclohexene-1-carboxylate synthase